MLFTIALKDNKFYQRCYKKGRFCADKNVCAYFFQNRTPYNRIGITVGKKQGCAVERNRVKRIIRAAYRLNEENFPIGYDIVFLGRKDCKDASSKDIEKFIRKKLIKEMNKPERTGQRKKR